MENLTTESKSFQEANEILTNIAMKFFDKANHKEKNKKDTRTVDVSNWQEWL